MLGALRGLNRPPEDIAKLKVAVVGAGSAGIGVAQALQSAMVEAGLPGGLSAAAKNFMVFDKDGLVGKSRPLGGPITEEVMGFAHSSLPDGMSLVDAVNAEKPQLILGLSGMSPPLEVRTLAARGAEVPCSISRAGRS